MNISLTALVPVYNESATVGILLEKLLEINEIDKIVVVDDCSNDKSAEIVRNLIKNDNYNKITLLSTSKNIGKGGALKLGFQTIVTSHVVIQDADLEYDPLDLKDLIYQTNNNPSSLILGSRFIGDKHRNNKYLRTYVANFIMSKIFSIVFKTPTTDIATCYKIYPMSFIKKIHIKEPGFTIEVELLAKFIKFSKRFIEVPITYNARSYAEGKKIKTIDGFKYILCILKYRFID